MSILQSSCVGLLVLIYGGSGAAELPMWRRFADDYIRWGLGRSWAIITPIIKLVAAVLTLVPRTRLMGAALCSIVALAAVITVARAKEGARLVIASVVCIVTLAAAGLMVHMG